MLPDENCQTKKFHFQEINKIVVFQAKQETSKYRSYAVQIKKVETVNQPTVASELGDFLDTPEVENNYPHTVGYYKETAANSKEFKPEYLELRRICTVEEFWFFLNSQNL